MIKLGWLVGATFWLLFVGFDKSAQGAVGVRNLKFVDAERGRTLETLVWYPAASSKKSSPKVQTQPQIYDVSATFDAALSRKSKMPLIILSHGSGGMPASLSWLGSRLAAEGFIVAAPTHPGDSFGNLTPEGTFALWNRPLDVSFVITSLLADKNWKASIDANRIGVAGFSMGGYTALAVAGADFSRDRYWSYCRFSPFSADCKLTDGLDLAKVDRTNEKKVLKDPRVRTAFSLSPFGGPGMSEDSLQKITARVVVAGVKDDEILSYEKNAAFISKHVPGSELITFEKGKHYVFVGPCSETGKKFVTELCGDLPGVDRGAIQAKASLAAVELFKSVLAE